MPRVKLFDQQKVLEKATELFWKKGYHATSMQDLVDHLGINRASIYDTYGGKRDLFKKAFSFYRRVNTEALAEMLDEELDIRTKLRRLFELSIEESLRDRNNKGCFVVNTTTELLPGDDEIEMLIRDNSSVIKDHFLQVLKRAEEHGEIEAGKDLESMASLLFTLYNGLKVVAKTKPSKEELLSSVDAALKILD